MWGLSDIGKAVSGGWDAAKSAVSDAASTTSKAVGDFSSGAVEKAKDLGQAGLDLGRRGVEAASHFDVREAASTVRKSIAEGTETVRKGVSDGVNWTSKEVGKGADWARNHVPGDNIVSKGIRGAITASEENTRFGLGFTGGVLREATSLVGTVGELGVTAAEIQASPQAAAEYGSKVVDGAVSAGKATSSYVENVEKDPSKLASDTGKLVQSGKDFASHTLDRYGAAIRDGRMEEIGMDAGTVATYLVPVGGGPVRGIATAAVRDATEATLRAGGETVARGAASTVTRDAAKATASETAKVATTATEQRGADLVGKMTANGGTAPLEQGAGRIADVAAASRQSGREIAVYRDGANGQRMMTMGGERAVDVPAGSKIIAHTQPGVGDAALAPSAADLQGLSALGQRSSAIIDHGGGIARFSADDAAFAGTRRAGAGAGEAVTFEAPRGAAATKASEVGKAGEAEGASKSLRSQYMGSTPSKYSRTGREVMERMRGEGKIVGKGPLLPGNPNKLRLATSEGKSVLIDRNVDMAHTIDAVSWWNSTGRFFGPKSTEVRDFMLDPDHYILQPASINRSEGARLGETYMPPAKAPTSFTPKR